MTFNDLSGHSTLVFTLTIIYRFINECARKKKAKIPDRNRQRERTIVESKKRKMDK